MPLNQNFYSFAVFLSALYAVIITIQGILYFLLGQQTYFLAVFVYWYLFSHIILLLGSVIFLIYFQVKKFQVVFWTMLVVTITSLIQFGVGFSAFMGMREMMSYYMSTQILVLGANILFAWH